MDERDLICNLFLAALDGLESGGFGSSGVLILVNEDHTKSRIESTSEDPVVEWFHFTRHLIECGHHPSDLIWGVVLAYEDDGQPEGGDASTRSE